MLSSVGSRIVGLNNEPLPPEFYTFAKANEAVWGDYHGLAELEKRAYITGLVVTPSEGTPRAMMLTQIDLFPSLLKQLTVVWTGGSTEWVHVQALDEAAERIAKALDCTRIQVTACALLYRQMKLAGYRPVSVDLIKDL